MGMGRDLGVSGDFLGQIKTGATATPLVFALFVFFTTVGFELSLGGMLPEHGLLALFECLLFFLGHFFVRLLFSHCE